MAETAVPAGLTVQQWDSKYFREYLNRNWFRKFMGTGSSKMIQVNEQLTKKPGDSVTFTLVNKLTGTATNSSGTLEGNEEAMSTRSHKVTIEEYSHAVKFAKFEAQKTAFDLRQAHKDTLMDWNMELDRDKIIAALGDINGVAYGTASEAQKDAWLVDNADRCLFGNALGNNASNNHSAALGAIDNTNDKLTPGALSLMKRMAKTANPKIRPIKSRGSIGDSDAYVVFAPSLVMRDLVNETEFKQANREARQRGKGNPLFDGADYCWDNLAIYEIEDINVLSNVGAGGTTDVAPVYLCGAQALGVAWSMRPKTVVEEFDYYRKVGIAVKQWYEIEKLRFGTDAASDTGDLKDHGVVTGFFAAVADA
jgi:N4-gp56 family major capsid protein